MSRLYALLGHLFVAIGKLSEAEKNMASSVVVLVDRREHGKLPLFCLVDRRGHGKSHSGGFFVGRPASGNSGNVPTSEELSLSRVLVARDW